MNQKSLFSPTIFQVLLNTLPPPTPHTKNITGNIKQPPQKIYLQKLSLVRKNLEGLIFTQQKNTSHFPNSILNVEYPP